MRMGEPSAAYSIGVRFRRTCRVLRDSWPFKDLYFRSLAFLQSLQVTARLPSRNV